MQELKNQKDHLVHTSPINRWGNEDPRRGHEKPKAKDLVSGRAGQDPRMSDFYSMSFPLHLYIAMAHKRTTQKPGHQIAVQSFIKAVESGEVKGINTTSQSIILMMKNF